MAIFDDPLLREEDPLDPERGSRGFGLRLFKSAEEAYRNDVVQRSPAPPATPDQAAYQALYSGGGGGGQPSTPMDDRAAYQLLFGGGAPAAPKPEQGDFSRGLSVSGKQLKQTAYGTAALVGDTLGADSLKDWGMKGYQAAENEVKAISKESDSFTNAVQSGEIGKWLTYSAGYLIGQVGELGAASIAGGLIGAGVGPGGAAIGALTGAVEKGAVQAGVRGFVGKMIDKQVTANMARGMTQEAAAQSALRTVYGTIGATTANTFLNATQELGSIYGDAVEEAALTGREYSLGKVWLSGIAATAVDSWADSKALGNIFGAAKGDKKLSGIAMEALKGGFREGMTEGVQTAIERWGADKDLTSKEAFKEYIDSAAVGILGGSVSGAGAGAVNKFTTPSDKPKADQSLTEDISTEAATDKAQPKLESPVAIERDELISVLRSPEAMAYLYQKADDEQKLNIEKAIEKAGAIEAFNQVKGQADAIQKGESMLMEFPEYQQALDGAIAGFAKRPTLNIKKGKTLEAPPSQFDAEPTSTEKPAETKPAGTQSMSDREIESSDGVRLPLVEVAKNGDGGMSPWLMADGKIVGTGQDHIGFALNATEGGLPGGYSDFMKRTGAIRASMFQDADNGYVVSLHMAEGQKPTPGQIKALKRIQQERGEPITVMYANKDGMVNPEYKTATLDQFIGREQQQESQREQRPITVRDLALQEQRAAGWNPDWPFIPADLGNADFRTQIANDPSIPQEEKQQIFDAGKKLGVVPKGEKLAAQPSKFEQAKQELKDAAADALDVVMDVSNAKMNITGKQYTVSDLPKAIQRVMEALVKMGYYKFEEVAVEVMKRIRANANWQHLADKVTPGMMRTAYKSLPKDGRQSDAEVDAVTATQLRDAVKVADESKSSNDKVVSFPQNKTRQTVRQLVTNDLANSNLENLESAVEKAKKEAEKARRLDNGKIADLVKTARSMPEDVFSDLGVLEELSPFERNAFNLIMSAEENYADAVKALEDYKASPNQNGKNTSAKAEKTASQESRDLDLEILAENKRLNAKYGKTEIKNGKEVFTPWNKVLGVPQSELAKLNELKKRQKELVAEIEEEARYAKPAEEFQAEKEKGKKDKEASKNEAPEVDYGTYTQAASQPPSMLDESRMSIPLRKLLKGMKRAEINKVRRALVDVSDEWLQNLGTEGLLNHLLPMSKSERMQALEALSTRSADELVKMGDSLEQLSTPEAQKILEFKRRIYGIMNLLNLNAPEAELSTSQNGDVTAKPGVSEQISVASAQQQAQFLRGTIAKIQKAIDDIDALLRGSRYLDDNGKTFVGKDESDENAYLWGDRGFRVAKDLPQTRLLEIRRQLMEQVRGMRGRTTKGIADLFESAAKNAEYLLSMERTRALREGIPDIVVDPIFNQARESIVGLMNDKAVRESIQVPSVQDALKVALDEAPLEAGDVVNQLADGIKGRTLTQDEMFTLASTAIRSGRLSQGQLIQALRDRGIDTPQEMLSASPLLAFQTRMMDYLNQHGHHPSYRLAWLTSMDQLVKRHPTLLKLNIFPEAEKVAYEMWKERTDAITQRRTKDVVMENSNDAADAFRDMLFTKYSLSQMRGAVPIPEREMMALKGTIGDLQEAWLQDVNFALKLRPELKDQLLDPEEGMIAPTDVQEFRRWQEKNDARLDREADAKARIPYYEALAAFDGSLPEDKLPGEKNAEKAKRKRDIIYRRLKTMIARAEIDELPKVIHNAQELYTKIANNIKTEPALDQMISDYLDVKQDQDQKINGQTIDQFYGMAERGVADTELTQKELDDMDSEDFEFEEDENQEEDNEDGPFRKRGAWSGEYTAAIVDGWVKKITAKWGSAPQITVLQNATMLPEPLRSKALARTGDLLDAAGLFDSETGHVYVFSDFIGSEADAQFVVFHEVYGHRGLRQFLGGKFDSFLEQMYRIYPSIKNAADEFMQTHGVGKLEAIDEVLSDMAGTNPDIGPVKSWIGRMVVGLREIGLGRVADWIAKISNAELSYYLKGARDAAQNGGYVSNGAPGVVRLAEAVQHERLSEMFALSGDKTKAYARFNPVTQTWFAYFATGDDVRDGAGAVVMDNYNDLLKLMRSKGHVEFRKRSGVTIPDRNVSDFAKLTEIANLTGMKAWMRSMITKYQNEYRPVFDLVEAMRAMGRLTERMDIKGALIDYERKTGYIIKDFRNRFVRPLYSYVQDAGKKGATSQIIDRYLLARTAEERNKQIAKINEQFPDGGSGMKTKTAKRYLKQLERQPYWQELQEIGRITDKISAKKLKYQFDTGMITAKQYQAMQVYKHYVNLSGRSDLKLDEFDDPMMLAGGSKFNVKGKEKRALGRKSEATEILSRTILGMESALIRGQKNQVAQRVLAFIEANYDPTFATINKIPYKQVIGEDGMVTDKEDDAYIRNPNVMVAKINGIPNTIEFKDTSAGSFAEAIHGVVGMRDNNALLERMGQFNQIVGQMLTTWNPAWGFVNFSRDLQTMYFNAAADGRITQAQAAQMVKTIPEALKIAYYMARTENLKKTNINLTREQAEVYREMERNGGLTNFLNRKDLPNQVEEIQKLLGERTRAQAGKDKFMSWMDAIEHNFSTPIEIAPRLAAYKVMREAGWSESEAARFAGEITVNFNMRGSIKATRQLYLFFNPAVQGSAKLLSLFGTLDHDYKLKFKTKGFAYVGLWVGLGAMMNLIGRALSDDDEAGRNAIDKLPVYKRATSMVLSADVPGAAIPIPYGWNTFYAMGHFMMDSLMGVQPITTSVKRIAQTAFESFAPLGSAGLDSQSIAGTALKGVAPTAALPIVEWVMNENRYGAPIRREDSVFGGAKLPDSQMAFRSVNPLSDAAMKGLNEAFGGNKFKSGAVDINPAAVDFVIGSYMPGFINESYKAAGMAARISRGEEVKNTPMPLIDRFTAKTPESYDAGAFRRAKEMIETKFNEYKNMPELRDEIRKESPGLMQAHAIVTSITQQIRKERANLTALENNKDVPDAEKVARLNRMREREKQLYNKAVKAVMDAGPEFKEAVMASD